MSLCVIDGRQCQCQPDDGMYCDRANALLAERDALRAENERLTRILLEQAAANVKPIVDRELANEVRQWKP